MGTLHHLNALITERLTTAAVEIFGAVEKTLIEYQGEISRSKREINQLRSLLSWPEVRLHRSADNLVSPCSDEEPSPEGSTPHVHPKPQSVLHIKEEHDQRAAQQGASCRQQSDVTVSPQAVTRGDHDDPPSHLYTVLTVEQEAAIKAEPHGDECLTTTCRINAESEVQQLNPEDPQEITYPKNHGTQQDQSQYQHSDNRHTSQIIKLQVFTSSRPQEDADCDCKLPHQPLDDYSEAPSLTPSPKCSLSHNAFTSAEKRIDAEGCTPGESTSVHSVEPEQLVGQIEHTENIEGLGVKLLKSPGRRQQKRGVSEENSKGKDSIGMEEDENHFIRERRHTCLVCAKRFKESSHLKDHVRIHTGEKPYRCKECGVNFRQSGALTLHMRIHTGERPYQCTECGRRFNRKGDMETHRVTHTGERPHSCLFCGKTFQRKSQLNTHLRIHEESRTDYTHPL